MWGMIATWRMAHDGVLAAKALLEQQGSCQDAVETAIKAVEDYPFYKSVGYGGLPNEEGVLEMDAAFMDGDTFKIGAVAGIVDVENPISVARSLSEEKFNSFRIGRLCACRRIPAQRDADTASQNHLGKAQSRDRCQQPQSL